MGRLVKIDNRTDNNINSNEKKGRLVRISDTPERELGYMIRDAKKRETPVPQPSRTTNNTARQQPRANSYVQGSGMSKLQQMEAQREERQQKTQNPSRAAQTAQIVREAEARSPRARSVQKVDTGTLNDRGSVQRARNGYELGEKRSRDTRAGKAVQSIALNTIGSAEMLGEGLKQANENVDIMAGDQIYSQLQGQYEQMGRQLNGAVQRYGMDSQEAESIRQSMNEVRDRLTARRGQIEKTIDTGSHAYRTAQMGQEAASQALEGLSGVGGFLGETALSIADNASLLPLAAINPALPLVIMSIKAAGSRAKELTDQGAAAGEALSRGVVSGIIEGLSENVSLGSLLEMVRTGGRGWLVNLLKQAGVEGAEEITSYIANYAMDKAAQDPNAQFDAGEMLRQGASGALSGLVFGGAGTAVNRLNGYSGVDYSNVDSIQGDGAPSTIERSVQNVRQTLGAEGQSTFDQMRTEGQDPSAAVEYTERFVDAYNKGKRNEAIPQAAEMTDAEAETRAAWNAGRVDALTQEGARNKQNQATREAGAGIIRTEYTDSLDQKTVSALDRAAKQLGVTVEFADEVAGGDANAEIQGNRITIEKWNRNPVRAVFGHEITHRIQELSADSYAEYKAAVQEAMGDRWTLELEATKALADQYDIYYSEDQLADEVAADYAGELLQNDGTLERFIQSAQSKPTLLQRIAQVFRDLVNKLRGTEKAQAELALGKLEKAYREAAKIEGENDATEETRYSLKSRGVYDYSKSFAEQVEDYEAGKIPERDSLLVGRTPEVFRKIGMTDLPVTINQQHIEYALHGTKDFDHALGAEGLRQLPKALESPVAILSSKTKNGSSLVAMLEIRQNGKQVVVPVAIDGYGTLNWLRIDSNAITSVYGKDFSISKVLKNALEDEANGKPFSVYYVNKEKAARLFEGARVLMPKVPQSSPDGFVHSIREAGSPVNPKLENVTQSQQFKRWFGDWQNHPENASKVVNEDGTPKVVYHQTAEDFTVFEPRHQGAGTRDSDTPFGIFMKSSDKNIGLNGEKQMALYARIVNPLTVVDRADMICQLKRISPEYVKAADELHELNNAYQKKYDDATKAFKDYIVEWRKAHPDASRTALYDDAGFTEVYNAEDNILDEWEAEARKLELRSKEAITRDLESHGYDGVIIQFDKGSWGRSTDAYIALRPEQVKSATDNVGTFDPENADIRFSLKGQGANDALVEKLTRQVRDGKITMEQALEQVRQDAADRTTAAELRSRKKLEQENARLRERVSALKAQMKPTEQKTVRKADTDRVSREILKAYDSEADAESIRDQVKALGDYLVESGGGDDGVSWEGLMARALPLGREIVENARVLNDDMAKEYADLRSYLRDTKLVISEQDSHDITDYNATRKALMGTVSLRRGENGNVESVYADMAARWPEFFNTEVITHPAEMVEHIREVMDAIKPSYENPHSANLDYAAEMAAQDVIERILGPDVRQSPDTYADRQAKKLEAQKARYQALLRKEKAKRADAIAKLKADTRAKDAARREGRNARDIRGKIERHTKALSKKLLNPTDKSHIPQRLRGPVAKALESINLQGKKEGSKRAEAFTQLKKAYQAIAQDDAGGFIVDPDLLGDQAEGFTGLFDRLIETADTPIHQMSASQLADVWKVVRGLEHAVETAGKTLASEKYAKTQDWVTAFSIDTLTRRPKRNGVMQRFIQDEMDPYTFFHQYGDSGMEVYRMLRNAQDTQTRRISALGEQVQRIIGDADMKKIQTTRHTFTTEEGKTLTLTDGQIMDLYNLARREQAQDHLMTGGIVQPEIKRSGKQKHIEQGNDSVRLTANDIQEIIGALTPEERTIADGLQKLTTSTLSGWGNEASMGAYGYEKFTQGDYWPIRSAKNALHSNVEKGGNNTRSIKNIGMAKATIPGANNAVEIGDVFDTFSRHAADMIDYSVWLLPMEDAGRLYNYRFRDEKGPTGQTIKGMLDKIGGKGSQQYWARLMEDIQNGINASADTSTERLIQKVVGNTKGARVGANVRVVLQQPTAFLRANAVLSPGSLTKGLVKGVTPGSGWEKAQKWAGIAKIKDVGGFDQGNVRSVSQQIYNTQTAMDKLNTVTSWGAEKADALTWGRLWNASEHETKRLHPELEAGSDAFYRKTAEIFTDMIDQSQVVDGILQRSQIMRSGNAFNKMATAFMGEPTKTLNMFIRAWDDFRYETDGKKRAAARGKFARTAAALVATDVVNALFQALWDAVRDDDKDKNYRQRLWRAMTGLDGDEVTPGDYAKALASGNIADNMNPLGRLPYVKDVLSIWQGYTVERADMDAIADAIKAAQSLNDAIQGKGKRTAWYAAEQLIGTTAVMFGVPVKTLTRDVRGLIRSIAQSTGSWEVVYEAEKFTYKPAANKKQFMDLLWTVKQKDESAYEAIRKDMEQNGYFAEDPKDAYHVAESSPAEQTRAYIDEQMEKRDRENSKGAGKISYEGLMDSVTQTSAYQQASAASKNKAADKASALAKGTSTGRSLAGKLEKYKIDPEEYLEYLLWMDKYDEPSKNGKYGSYTNEERKKAIDATNASKSTKAGLWILAGGSEKSNPYD